MSAENLSGQVDMSISGTLNTPFKLAEISTYSTVLPLGKGLKVELFLGNESREARFNHSQLHPPHYTWIRDRKCNILDFSNYLYMREGRNVK